MNWQKYEIYQGKIQSWNVKCSDLEEVFQKLEIDKGKIKSWNLDGRTAVLARPEAVQKWSHIKKDFELKMDINLKVEKVRYCVLFTLDISGSMNGSRWKQVSKSMFKL